MRAVLLAHGSPDPRSGDAVRGAASAVAARLGSPVIAAFLDHDRPDLAAAVGPPADDDEVVVLPMLLSSAYHARVDVPAAVAALGHEVRLLDPLGHPPAVLKELLRREGGPVVVVAAGTRVDEERQAFTEAVAAAALRTRVPATAAFATGPGRRIEDATRPGGATVIPWLLAPGRLLDSVRVAAQAHACTAVGGGLVLEASLLEEIARRLSA